MILFLTNEGFPVVFTWQDYFSGRSAHPHRHPPGKVEHETGAQTQVLCQHTITQLG